MIFKQEAVRLYETSGKPIYQTETNLGITHGLLNKWKRQLRQQGVVAFPGQGRLTPEQEEIQRLKRNLAIAEQELKTAVPLPASWLHMRQGGRKHPPRFTMI